MFESLKVDDPQELQQHVPEVPVVLKSIGWLDDVFFHLSKVVLLLEMATRTSANDVVH